LRCGDSGVDDQLGWRSAETYAWGNLAVSSSGTTNLPVRTAVTGWHGDVDPGGKVAASDRPGRNSRAFKGAWLHQSRPACGIDVPNILRQVGPSGSE
jgi:hypothetical protein